MKSVLGKGLVTFALISLGMLVSCEEDKIDFSPKDSNSVENETVTESYFEDVDDMSTMAVSADGSTSTGSRESGAGRSGVKPSDSRFACATITFEFAADNTLIAPHGYIIIDFGSSGCADAYGNVRKGMVMIEFIGKRFMSNSQIVTTLMGYSINDIKIEGKRTVTNLSASLEVSPKFSIVVQGGKATWPDGTFATRETNRTVEWVRAVNPLNDELVVTGNATGSNRFGDTFVMEITSPLVYKRTCVATSGRIAVEGSKVLTVNDKEINVDYGTGTCDRMITVTIEGVSKEIEIKGKV
jgi:hypothetical protein